MSYLSRDESIRQLLSQLYESEIAEIVSQARDWKEVSVGSGGRGGEREKTTHFIPHFIPLLSTHLIRMGHKSYIYTSYIYVCIYTYMYVCIHMYIRAAHTARAGP